MSKLGVLAAGVSAVMMGAGVYAAAPKAAAPKAGSTAPVASYWMDVATQSGMGAGMMGGGRPSAAQVMAMMNGGGGQAVRTLDLRLASKDKAAAPQADHLIPTGLQMGASLPLLTPVRVDTPADDTPTVPQQFEKPKGRMLIYWGCGEHVAAGEPTVIDFSKIEPGKMPPGMAALSSMAHGQPGPMSAPGFGRWPNERDSRQVPATGSLLGAHKVEANYAPPIAFSLGSGEDFMAALGLREAGALPSGASRLAWQPAPTATGYALSMFASNGSGDMIMWTSAKTAQMPAMDYLSPSEVRRLIAAGAVLPPSASECVLPAEVAAAAPQGMVMMIGYGPEADFSDNPKTPKWTTKVRFKTTASLMRGMRGMMGGMGDDDGGYAANQQQPQQQQVPQQQPPKKRRGIGLGDLLGAIPH